MDDLSAKNRLIVLAYAAETEPVPYALLVTLILSGLSMDYFAFQQALSDLLESRLLFAEAVDDTATGNRQMRYRLSENGRTVLESLIDQLKPAELNWLRTQAPDYTKRFYEHDLTGTFYREADGGYVVSLGKSAHGRFDLHITFRTDSEADAKKAVGRFQNDSDGVIQVLKEALLDD